MYRYSFLIFITVYFVMAESSCVSPSKFYIDCGSAQTLTTAIQVCNQYGMTVVNLTNTSSLANDTAVLNQTLSLIGCTSQFWFASGNGTGYIASISTLGGILIGLLTGTLNLAIGIVADVLNCLLIFCALTTTPPPITSAVIVCTRPLQQQVIQKCQAVSGRSDMKIFQFHEAPMYGGILNSFPSSSRTICSGLCSSDTSCTGISYINGICNLYV